MPAIFTALFFYFLTLYAMNRVAAGRDREFLWRTITLAWMILFPLTANVDLIFPFTGGGDDESYFYLGSGPVQSLGEAFDLTRFAGIMAQPGYPWLLSVLNYFAGADLLAFKVLNLHLFILLTVVWYRIGVLLQDTTFGRRAMIALLLLTPLWLYFFFLLKDMAITFLQSLFILGLVEQRCRNSFRARALIVLSLVALFLFRTPLVLQSSAVLLSSLLFAAFSRHNKSMIWAQLIGWIFVVGLLFAGSDPELMASLGIYTEQRLLGSSAMVEAVAMASEESQMNRILFPLLYLFTETAGLSPTTWEVLDPVWLRGFLALPWIFIGVPFFLLGIIWLVRVQSVAPDRKAQYRWRDSRLIASPWGILALFFLSYLVISWRVGDTTRWRIPDMPVNAVIALAGWQYTRPRIRWQVLLLWLTSAGSLFSLFYLLKG